MYVSHPSIAMKDANYCPSTLAVLISEVVLRNADIRLDHVRVVEVSCWSEGGEAVKWPPVDLQWREPVTSLFATEDVFLSVTSLFAIEDVSLCESGDEPLAAFIFLLFTHTPCTGTSK